MSEAVRLHPANRKVLEFRGRPLVMVCATEHYGAVMNRPFRFDRYLVHAGEMGQTLTRLFALFRELQTPRNPYSTCKPETTDYVTPFERVGPEKALDGEPKFDLSQWNPEYFDRLHRFVELASEQGIIVELTLFSNTYSPGVWALNPLNAMNTVSDVEEICWSEYLTLRHPKLLERQLAHVRKIVTETNRYDNIIYEICNEPGGKAVATDTIVSADEVDAWQRKVAGVIRETEEGLTQRHLISGQQAFMCEEDSLLSSEQPSDLSFAEFPVDIVNIHPLPNTTHAGKMFDLGPFMSKQLCLRPFRAFCLATQSESKPLNMDEDNIASMYRDYDGWTIHRKRAWTSLMCGCHYDYIDFSINSNLETGTEESRRHIRSWIKHLSGFVHSLDLSRAKPFPKLLSRVPPHTLESVLAIEGEDYCIYLADARELGDEGCGETLEGSISFDLPAGEWRCACLSPETGLYSPSVTVHGGAPTVLQVPPFRHDMVLRVRC